MENHKRINKYLKDHFGTSFNGRPKFRLVWSDNLHEHRRGLHSPFAVIPEVKEVLKYNYLSERWVLEVDTLAFQDVYGRAIREKMSIVVKGDGYEPLRVFQTKKGVYLRPDLEICKIICDNFVELINRPEGQRLTEKRASANDVIKMREEVEKFYELLNADDSDIIHKFRDGEAVLIHRDGV